MKDQVPRVLLLGTGHWANPGRDYINVQFDDMLAPDRQREIREVADHLKRFAPTKIALEVDPEAIDAWNTDYTHYHAGAFTLTASEHHQLGFRIAADLGHDQVYGIDWNEGTFGLDTVFDFAASHQPELFAELQRLAQPATDADAHQETVTIPLRELLLQANAPATQRRMHQPYLLMAQVGAGRQYVGVDWVKGWYERNLIIFANLCRLFTSPSERVLVIYGAGHVPLLTQFLRESDVCALESVDAYLA
jgi:hypothetical protein